MKILASSLLIILSRYSSAIQTVETSEEVQFAYLNRSLANLSLRLPEKTIADATWGSDAALPSEKRLSCKARALYELGQFEACLEKLRALPEKAAGTLGFTSWECTREARHRTFLRLGRWKAAIPCPATTISSLCSPARLPPSSPSIYRHYQHRNSPRKLRLGRPHSRRAAIQFLRILAYQRPRTPALSTMGRRSPAESSRMRRIPN